MPETQSQTLRVQVVLKDNSIAQIWRLLWGLASTCGHATKAQLLKGAQLGFGDCSDSPVLTPQDFEALTEHAVEAGLNLSYEFFGSNLGHSGGHNRLAQSAPCDLLMLLNPDAYPAPQMLVELLTVLRSDESVGIVEARQIPIEHPKDFDLQAGDTSWASGCCLVIRKRIFELVGGFDSGSFPLQCDDVDLSWRVRLQGFRVVHVPKATVFHDKGIGSDGYPIPGRLEPYYATLGRLMLAVRYGKPEVLKETIDHISLHGSEHQRRALEEFRRRKSENLLPSSIPGAEGVSQFVGGEYARHRF